MLSAEDIRRLKRQGKTIKEIAEQERVGTSAIYCRLERDEKRRGGYEDLPEETKERYRKSAIAATRKNQEKTDGTASNHRQLWTSKEISELEKRVKKRETIGEIAIAMHRTYRGIGRALHRFGLSERRSELVGT